MCVRMIDEFKGGGGRGRGLRYGNEPGGFQFFFFRIVSLQVERGEGGGGWSYSWLR